MKLQSINEKGEVYMTPDPSSKINNALDPGSRSTTLVYYK
jgi:hypothetical protein